MAEPDEELEAAKFWLPLSRPPSSRGAASSNSYGGYDTASPPMLLLSIQLVPAADAERLPAGHGRSEPNSNPVLPKPVGRLKLTLNPISMMLQLLGPKLCRRLTSLIGLVLCSFVLWSMIPVLFANVITEVLVG